MKGGKSFETIDMEGNEKTEDDKEDDKEYDTEELMTIDEFLSEQKLFSGTVKSVFESVAETFFVMFLLFLIPYFLILIYYYFFDRLPSKKVLEISGLFFLSIELVLIVWFAIPGFLSFRFSSRWFKWKYLMVLIGIILPVSIYIMHLLHPILDEEYLDDQLSIYTIVISKLFWILTASNIAVFLFAYYKTIRIIESLYSGKGVYRVIYRTVGSSSKKMREGKQW